MNKIVIISLLALFLLVSCGEKGNNTGQNIDNVNNNGEQGVGDVEGFLSHGSDGEFLENPSNVIKEGASIDTSSVSDDNPFNF